MLDIKEYRKHADKYIEVKKAKETAEKERMREIEKHEHMLSDAEKREIDKLMANQFNQWPEENHQPYALINLAKLPKIGYVNSMTKTEAIRDYLKECGYTILTDIQRPMNVGNSMIPEPPLPSFMVSPLTNEQLKYF